MHILVTGASGFVGSHILKELQNTHHKVSGLYRKKPAHIPEGITPLITDISPSTHWPDIVKDIDAIIHTGDGLRAFEGQPAPQNHTDPKAQQAQQVVQTTIALAQAANEAGVQTFVYLSSIKAISGYCATSILTEKTSPSPNRPYYGQLKYQIEQQLLAQAASQQMHIIALRSPIIYGDGGIGNFSRLIWLANNPWPLPMAGFQNRRSIVCVTNLAHALVTAAENRPSLSGQYFIHDGVPLPMSEIITLIRQGFGRSTRLFTMPHSLIRFAALLPIAKPIISRLAKPLEISSQKFERDFDWHPQIPTKIALLDMIKSIKKKQG